MLDISRFNPDYLKAKAPYLFSIAVKADSLDELRTRLSAYAHKRMFEAYEGHTDLTEGSIVRVRDCANIIIHLMTRRSEEKANFSVAQAIRDIAQGKPRADLSPAFFAELLHLFLGLEGRGPGRSLADLHLIPSSYRDREAALERSRQLDELNAEIQIRISKFTSGLDEESIRRREERQKVILGKTGGSPENWDDWHWHTKHVLRDADIISQMLVLSEDEHQAITLARKNRLPFGITPYYLSLMDDDLMSMHDRAIRAQVIPPPSYVQTVTEAKRFGVCLDFMLESDTSPIDLVTRRYPGICILKPFNTCPQICVYCQRNWEIDDAMATGAMASEESIQAAVRWIRDHPAIHEVLVTGGDPLAMPDEDIDRALNMLADIPSIERIRIGSRTLVTLPMRITDNLAGILAGYRLPGRRQIAVATHIQHPYEVTPETVAAVERLRLHGISVYNQLVYTFFVSRRFEAAYLRRLLSRIGIDPYYTFNTKGKEETSEYRVPIARILQEQKEEARLLPGLSRTDEAVYNIPGLGKNYLRASIHRGIVSVLADGTRLYEFHPWEKNVSAEMKTHLVADVAILDYLLRLDEIGENVYDYETIWYYY